MKIPAIRTKIIKSIRTRRLEKEDKFLNKYCHIKDDFGTKSDAYIQLTTAQKTIANYAKRNGVTIDISDAEKKVAKDFFEDDVCERICKRTAKDNLSITVRPVKHIGNHTASEVYVSKDTSKTYLHSTDKQHQYEDGFLRNIYRKIENIVHTFQKEKALVKKK